MTNYAKMVWDILDRSPSIRLNMSRGLINHRALARYIIKERNVNAPLDAIVSAIRRYDFEKTDMNNQKALQITSQSSTMSTKSALVNVALIKDDDVQKLLPQLFSVIQYSQGDVLRIIQANRSIKLLIDERNLEKVKAIFPEDKIIRIDKNIAEINVHMHPDARQTPGVLAAAANELAINGINILEAMSCFPEWLWFVDESDLLKAYNALNKLNQQHKEFIKRFPKNKKK
jgi:aspartokinase